MNNKDMVQIPNNTKINLGGVSYFIQSLLGNGQFGMVYQAFHVSKKEQVAIKTMNLKILKQNPKIMQLLSSEIEIMKKIKNPNVVRFIDFQQNKDTGFLILELCNGGDLDKFVKTTNITQEMAIGLFQQIINGMSALHQQHIIHRDLKLPNIFIHNETLKIGDLGFAKQMKYESELTKTILGTPLTMAPEVLENKSYNLQADIYSLGVIFYQILFKGQYPFNGNNQKQLLQNIKGQIINFNVLDIKISQELQNLIRRMLKEKPEERIKWSELSNLQLFQQNLDKQQNNNDMMQIQDLNKSVFQSVNKKNQKTYKELEQQNRLYQNSYDNPVLFDPAPYEAPQNKKKIFDNIKEEPEEMEIWKSFGLSKEDYERGLQQQLEYETDLKRKRIEEEENRQKALNIQRLEDERKIIDQQKYEQNLKNQQKQQQQQQQQQQISLNQMVYKSQAQLQQQQQIFQNNLNYQNNLNRNQDNDEYMELLKLQQQSEQEKKEVKQTLELYLNELNIINYLITVVNQAHNLPPTQINTYYPVFFLLKKYIVELQNLKQNILNQKNIFNCTCPEKLFQSDEYQNLINTIEDKYDIGYAYFIASKMDIDDLMQKTPQPEIMEQLNEEYNKNFNSVYLNTLINYISNLQDEFNNNRLNQLNAETFLKHLVDVSDCISLDNTFGNKKYVFNFIEHSKLKKQLDTINKQKYVYQKIQQGLNSQQ